MPKVWYRTPDDPSRRLSAAPTVTAALLELRRRHVEVAAAGEEKLPRPGPIPRRWAALIPIYEQLGSLLGRGMPLHDALVALARQMRRLYLRYSLQRLAEEVAGGRPLHEAMALQPTLYSEMVVNMVAAGEAADELATTFRELGQQQRQVRSAVRRLLPLIAYPTFIVWIVAMDLTFLGTFIMPKFIQLYRELGMSHEHFPLVTRVMVPVMRVAPPFITALIVALAVLFGLWRVYDNLLRGRLSVQIVWFRVPMLGRMTQLIGLARAASALGLLLQRRVPPDRALRLAGQAADNAAVAFAFRRAATPVSEGAFLGEALADERLLPADFVQEVAAAETGGTLPEALGRLSSDYWQQVLYRARTQPYIIAPIIIVLLGILIALVAVGLFSPLVAIIGELSG